MLFVFLYASKYKNFLETAICTRLIIITKKDTGGQNRLPQYTVPSSLSRHTQNTIRTNYIQMVLLFRILISVSLL